MVVVPEDDQPGVVRLQESPAVCPPHTAGDSGILDMRDRADGVRHEGPDRLEMTKS